MTSPTPPVPTLDLLPEPYLRQLIRISQEFNSTIDIDALLPRVLDRVLQTVGAEAGSLWMLEGDILRCRLARGPAADRFVGLELPLGAGIVGDAALKRRAVLVREVGEDDRFLHQLDEITGMQTQSVIAVPLVVRGEVLGAIEVVDERSDDEAFQEEHRLFLEVLADDAAAAIRNAQLFEAELRARDLAALLEVSHEITASLDQQRVLVSIVNLAGRAVRFDRCVLALWEGESLRVRAISGEEMVNRSAAAVRELERFLLWVAERAGEIYVPDLDERADALAVQIREGFPRYLEDSRLRGFFVVPVSDAEGKLGLLHFEFAAPDGLSDWARKACILLANEAALALRNAQLYENVPFISWLEPLAQRRKALASLPGSVWLRYGGALVAAVLILFLFRLPLRLGAVSAEVRARVQQPARTGIDGTVDAVWVREGERVAAGAPIARVRDEELLTRFREARAGLALAQGEAVASHASGNATGAALARLRVEELEEVVALLGQRLERARVVAPAAGIVLTPRLEELLGSRLPAGTPVTWIGDPEWVELELKMSQNDLGEIRLGDRVRAKISSHPTVTFEGRVTAIAPRGELDPSTGSPVYAIRAVLDNREQLLRPGMTARARVITRPRPLALFLFRRPWRWVRMTLWW